MASYPPHRPPVIKRLFGRIDVFSRRVIGMKLHAYQVRALEPVVDSVLGRHGREFLLVFPRQSGKNEAVAHLLVYLLNALQNEGGNIVYGAVGDGLGRGIRRLEQRLNNWLNVFFWGRASRPPRRTLKNAAVVFLSSHPQAFARGETAHWLLVIDELQDQWQSHLDAVFQPMRAAYNATALYIGTVRFTHDALWKKKQELERLQAKDGHRRVFMVSPEEVTAANPHYRAFLAAQEEKLGRKHPIIQSEYYLQPIDAEGGLFGRRRMMLMKGQHERLQEPARGRLYVATVDVAGADEGATDPIAQLDNPGRDYTVATVFEVQVGDANGRNRYLAVDVFVDHGGHHFQDQPGAPSVARRLLAWLEHWAAAHVVVDKTGVGEGLADWLAAQMGPTAVTGFQFTRTTKAALGNSFLALIETGRFKYWGDDAQEPLSDGWWFWQQVEHCTYELQPGQTFEKHLRWWVPASATVDTPAGSEPVHDDRLISAALIAHFDTEQIAPGRGDSAVIAPSDPLAGMSW